jgi:hypothetical protein
MVDSEDNKVQLKITMNDPDATEAQRRDATRLFAAEQKNIEDCKAKLATMAEAVQESVEPESKRQRLGEDEAPPGGLQSAEEPEPKFKWPVGTQLLPSPRRGASASESYSEDE